MWILLILLFPFSTIAATSNEKVGGAGGAVVTVAAAEAARRALRKRHHAKIKSVIDGEAARWKWSEARRAQEHAAFLARPKRLKRDRKLRRGWRR